MTTDTDDTRHLELVISRLPVAEIVDQRPVSLVEAAAFYARALHWPVFPLQPGGKRPLTSHGFHDATTDLEVITAWWSTWPEANIGTPTGLTTQGGCGYDVIDVDGPDGYASIAQLRHADCPSRCCANEVCTATGSLPPISARSFTPGNPHDAKRPRPSGMHLWTVAVGSACTTRALPGIDLRGDGGYVVIPPSVGPSGARYAWLERPAVPVVTAPDVA